MKFTVPCTENSQYDRSLRWKDDIHKTGKGMADPFLCAHLCRKGFTKFHGEKVPTLIDEPDQIGRQMVMVQQRAYGATEMLYSYREY